MMTWNKMFFQSPSTLMMEIVVILNDYVMMFLLSILILVMLNILYNFVMKNFNLNFKENHKLEWIWTLIPFFLLIFIAFPSLVSLYISDTCFFCGFNVNIMGHQWYWTYSYKENLNLTFDSYMINKNETKLRLLEVDNCLIIPCFFPIRFLISSSDVIHSWTIPSFGIKFDAIPGRINQFCLTVKRSGIFFGQCSEICGANHSFMPIMVEIINNKFFF